MRDAVTIGCPYCGEPIEILLEPSDDPQHYIEDCQVCCRPIVITVHTDVNGEMSVSASAENDA